MRTFISMMLAAITFSTAPAALAAAREDSENVSVLDTSAKCASPGVLCFAPGDSRTLAMGSDPLAALVDNRVATTPQFARAGTNGGFARRSEDTPWALRLDAQLKQPALAGTVLVLVYDDDDDGNDAVARHEPSAAYHLRVPATKGLALQLTLSPTEGVAAGHTYRVQLVQIVKGAEVVLADGRATLK
jgi:hypothetical protein